MADLAEQFWRAPPVTRTLVAAMFVESGLVMSGLLPFQLVIYYNPWIFKFPPELWRLLSSFILTGGGLSFILDLYFTWTYGSDLELNSPRFSEPGAFFVYLCFCATVIWVTAGLLLGALVFTSSLLMAFIYSYAQDNRGRKVQFIVFPIRAELLPWAMLLLTFILAGPKAALQQATGVVAAHLYDFLTSLYPTFQGGRNYLQTPAGIHRYFGGVVGRVTNKAYGTSIRPEQPTAPGNSSRGWTSGLSSSWNGRGAGRRLGGD